MTPDISPFPPGHKATIDWIRVDPRDMGRLAITVPPPPVGFWCLGNGFGHTKFAAANKPTRLQRYFMRKLLGFHWEDA